jgi:hypothetical protein
VADETDFLNDALQQAGCRTITGIDDGSTEANKCLTFWPTLRDGMLRSHHWKFSKKRQELAQDAETPAFEFAFQYTLPADPWCLKVIEYNGASLDTSNLALFESATISRFKIEGRKLLTNDGEVKIVFLARITNPDEWDAMFYQCAATWLGAKLALAIPKDRKMAATLMVQAMDLWSMATAVDGQEGSTEPFISNDLLWGR